MQSSNSVCTEANWATEVLPWYVNGTLDSAESQRFERHLERCEHCQRELSVELELRHALLQRSVVDYAPHASLAKVREQLDIRLQQPRKPRIPLARRPTVLWSALAAQAAVIATLAIVLLRVTPDVDSQASYRTVSEAAPASTAAIQIVFDDELTAGELRSLLDSVGTTIVRGPSEAGVYELSLYDDAASVKHIINVLREHAGVKFVAQKVDSEMPR